MPDINDKAVTELVDLGKSLGAPQETPGGNTPFVVIPNTYKVVPLGDHIDNERSEHPRRAKGVVCVLDAPSFCEYYRLFADENSRVFADETADKVLAVLDYHESGGGNPRWGAHRLDLTLRNSEEWEVWTEKDGEKLTQMEFAEFIEDNAPDIVQPSAATMLEVAHDLSAKSDVDFGSVIRMQNGSVQFKYSEQIKGTFGAGNLEVPERFVISVPVYINTERIDLTARLRYRINAGKLTFWYQLLRADAAEREAFMAVRHAVGDALEIVIINGAPLAGAG